MNQTASWNCWTPTFPSFRKFNTVSIPRARSPRGGESAAAAAAASRRRRRRLFSTPRRANQPPPPPPPPLGPLFIRASDGTARVHSWPTRRTRRRRRFHRRHRHPVFSPSDREPTDSLRAARSQWIRRRALASERERPSRDSPPGAEKEVSGGDEVAGVHQWPRRTAGFRAEIGGWGASAAAVVRGRVSGKRQNFQIGEIRQSPAFRSTNENWAFQRRQNFERGEALNRAIFLSTRERWAQEIFRMSSFKKCQNVGFQQMKLFQMQFYSWLSILFTNSANYEFSELYAESSAF